MNILVTGGAGYIGSHTVVKLLEAGHTPIVIDNLSNSSRESIHRIEMITTKKLIFYEFDVRDTTQLDKVFRRHAIDAVIHFAGLKAVGESVEKPLLYYTTNLESTFRLLEVMQAHAVNTLIFSSSATVYGDAPSPCTEQSPIGHGITNPYGQTKFMIETILADYERANPSTRLTILRYFNPIGAHPSGLIGESPHGIPNNLMPYISQVAVGSRAKLGIFGNDYPTADGTGVRDYIHVDDLAEGHLAALEHAQPGLHVYNLGTGHGTSVLELIHAFETATGKHITYEIVPRRAGDLAESYADVSLAAHDLKWHTTHTIADGCRDSWNWQSKNPNGYNT